MPFWREEPLTPSERNLIDLLFAAHDKSARRANLSAQTIKQGAQAGVPFTQALASGLLTLGGLHGPVERTVAFYEHSDVGAEARRILARGERVPGFGSSFSRLDDPNWEGVRRWFESERPDLTAKVEAARSALKDAGKTLAPNPATYTALTAIELLMPAHIASYLFVASRLSAWAEAYVSHTRPAA